VLGFQILGSSPRYSVLGSRSWVPDPGYLILGVAIGVYSTWVEVLGLQILG